MKLTVIRNSMTGGRAAWMVIGGILGLLAAATTIWLSLLDPAGPGAERDLLATTYLIWLLGWIVGPVWGGPSALRIEHFTLLPIPRRQLAVGLLGTAFVAITTAVTALAFLSLVAYGARLGLVPALIALPAAALQLMLVVLLSRASSSVFGRIAMGRLGTAFAGTMLGLFLVLTQSGWIVVVAIIYSKVLTNGFPSVYSTVVQSIPSGWGLVAVDAAHRGQWLGAVGMLAATAALIVLLLLAWSRTLGSSRHGRPTIRGSSGVAASTRPLLGGPTAAVIRKELRTWWRDPLRTQSLATVGGWALGTVMLPLALGTTAALPWAGPAMALMAATVACNLYSADGTALWLTLQTATERADVRGRQWAYLLVFGLPTLAVTIGFTIWGGYAWAWPWVLALTPALLGGGVGLSVYASVAAPAPGPDAHQRPDNPLEHADTTGQSQVLFWAGLLPAIPAAAAVLLGEVYDNAVLVWSGVPVGLATGAFLGWWLGRLAANRLVARGPEMLVLMRSGRNVPKAAQKKDVEPAVRLTKRQELVRVLSWILGPLLLFPQGLVPIVFLLLGVNLKLWFLALYMPGPLRWPTAIVMALLGLYLCYRAIWLTVRRGPIDRRSADPAADGTDRRLESV